MAITPGWIVTNRHYFAALGRNFPHLTRTGMTIRLAFWGAFGWPIAACAVALLWLTVFAVTASAVQGVVPFGALAGWGWAWGGLVFEAGEWNPWAGPLVLFVPFAALIWFGRKEEIKIKRDGKELTFPGPAKIRHAILSPWGRFFSYASMFMATGFTIGGILFGLLLALIPVFWWVDAEVGRRSDHYDGRRQFAEFRRELPVIWAILAGKSTKIQSLDVSLESTLGDAAIDRPLLEAPAFWLLPRQVGPYTFEVPVWRTPGRGLPELQDVLDELAAQFANVGDFHNSIELLDPTRTGSKFASWAWMRITFKTREEREHPFGPPQGGPGGRRPRPLRHLVERLRAPARPADTTTVGFPDADDGALAA